MRTPFGPDPVAEVRLPHAPLALALAQVQFPELSSMAGTEVLDALSRRLAPSYPIKREEQASPSFSFSEQGPVLTTAPGVVRILVSADEQWQLRVAPTSLTLSAMSYAGRRDFIERLAGAWGCFAELAGPPFIERLGVRYVNAIDDETLLARLPDLVRTEVLGPRGTQLGGVSIEHSLDDSLFRLDPSDFLQVRTGILPPGVVLDPVLGPVTGRAWVLDLDASRGRQGDPSEAALRAVAEELCARAYRYFRWAVTEDFLAAHGGS